VDKKEILKWIAKIMFVIVLTIIIIKLSDKYGEGRVHWNALAFALLLFSIGKLLQRKK
jgi:ribosomal protein S24E